MPNAPIPVRIVNSLTTPNEVGRVVDVLPVRATTDLVAVNEVGRPIDVPLATIEAALIATNEVGGAVSVTPVRIVTNPFVPDAAGRLVFAQPLRGLVVSNPPVNTALPVISQTGSVLSVTTGTWTGAAPITYAYQWSRNGTPIGGATAANYTIPDANLSALFGCIVTATNSGGNASAAAALLYVGVLDALSVASAVSFSSRRQRRNHTGNAMRVRRSSDNAEADIGFTANGDIDTTALLTFVGAGNGFVTTWYDQSGNGRNATQTMPANQPRIVSNGVIETENGKPTVRVMGGQFMTSPLTTEQAFAPGMKMWISSVFRADTNTEQSLVATALPSFNILAPWSDGKTYFDVANSNPRTSGPLLWTNLSVGSFISNGTIKQVWKNGVLSISSVSAPFADKRDSNTFVLFGYGVSPTQYMMKGCGSNMMIFPTAPPEADRQTLERNEGAYFGITVA